MPNIAVSFDQMRAVRLGDGARLVARPSPREDIDICLGCEAALLDSGSCIELDVPAQCCSGDYRPDKRNIVWRLAE